jgi:hypothetical protein
MNVKEGNKREADKNEEQKKQEERKKNGNRVVAAFLKILPLNYTNISHFPSFSSYPASSKLNFLITTITIQ